MECGGDLRQQTWFVDFKATTARKTCVFVMFQYVRRATGVNRQLGYRPKDTYRLQNPKIHLEIKYISTTQVLWYCHWHAWTMQRAIM